MSSAIFIFDDFRDVIDYDFIFALKVNGQGNLSDYKICDISFKRKYIDTIDDGKYYNFYQTVNSFTLFIQDFDTYIDFKKAINQIIFTAIEYSNNKNMIVQITFH